LAGNIQRYPKTSAYYHYTTRRGTLAQKRPQTACFVCKTVQPATSKIGGSGATRFGSRRF
jgi:hypothetical protein